LHGVACATLSDPDVPCLLRYKWAASCLSCLLLNPFCACHLISSSSSVTFSCKGLHHYSVLVLDIHPDERSCTDLQPTVIMRVQIFQHLSGIHPCTVAAGSVKSDKSADAGMPVEACDISFQERSQHHRLFPCGKVLGTSYGKVHLKLNDISLQVLHC